MSIPVVVVPAGGFPVTEALSPYGTPMTESPTGYGLPVTFSTGGFPVTGISAFIPGSPVNTVAPVISGTTTIGQVLSCTTGTWSPTATSYAYFWRRNGSLIAGATASTYTLVAADNAAAMTCRVIGTNAIGPSLAIISNTLTLADVTPVNSVAPAITGTAAVGSVLTVTNGTWSNSPSFTRQWRRGGVAIGSATATTYTLVVADNIAVIDCVVTAINAAAIPVTANSNSVTVAEARPMNSVAPVVTGTATVGNTLSCSTGTWSNTPTAYAYQWLRSGVAISGATSATYLLVSADIAASVLCRVTASNTVGATPTPVDSNAMVIGSTGTTTVTAPNGQWWKFNGTVTNGIYVNGDPWVLDPGAGVSLIEVSTPTTGTGATTKHGGMINPTFNTYAENTLGTAPATSPMKIGYDGRLATAGGGTYVYDSTLNAHLGLPRTLVAGDSLVSAVCNADSEIAGSNPVAFARMACVTVVGTTPFADSFRPNYFGTTKINKRFSDANTALLVNLSAMSPFDPKGAWTEGFHLDMASVKPGSGSYLPLTHEEAMHRDSFRDLNYWVCTMMTNGTLMKPQWNMEPYPRDWGQKAGQLSMYILINPSDRDHLLKRMLQVAIDAHAISLGAGYVGAQPWGGGAGFWASPAWWIRLAGLLFNDTPMKNVMSVATGQTDYYGNAKNKWGIRNRCYLTPNATAHAQYYRVPGESYASGFPLFGDLPNTDISGGLGAGSNNSARDPTGITDMDDFKYLLPDAAYPAILTTAYENWKVAGVEQKGPGAGTPASPYGVSPIGNYAKMSYAMMGDVCASIAMGDQAFWGGAVVAYAKRHAHDAQMWSNFGHGHDYSDGYLTPARLHRDYYAHGGTQSGWMVDMWEEVVGTVVGPSLGSAPLVVTLNPLDGATSVAASSNLTVTFDMNVAFNTGTINIYRASDDVLFESFSVTTDAGTKLTIAGAVLTINPAGTMAASTPYYVQIASTAIKSATTASTYAGIADETTWNFTVASAGATVIYDVAASLDNSGLEDQSRRGIINITGGAGTTNQIRVTFPIHTTNTQTIQFASIAKSTSSGSEIASTTPVQLLFDGGSPGFTRAGGSADVVSDWVTLGGFTASDTLLVTVDFGTTNAAHRYKTGAAHGQMYALAALNANNYNQITGTWTSFQGGTITGFSKVEVQ